MESLKFYCKIILSLHRETIKRTIICIIISWLHLQFQTYVLSLIWRSKFYMFYLWEQLSGISLVQIKVNKSVYIAKSRQQCYKTLNNILLHVPNNALKDVYMLNYGTIKNRNILYDTPFFIINFFIIYILIKTDWAWCC